MIFESGNVLGGSLGIPIGLTLSQVVEGEGKVKRFKLRLTGSRGVSGLSGLEVSLGVNWIINIIYIISKYDSKLVI